MLSDVYQNDYYIPAAIRYAARHAENGALGVAATDRQHSLRKNWHSMSFAEVDIETHNGHHYFRVVLDFGLVDPADVLVKLYAKIPAADAFRHPFALEDKVPGSKNSYTYSGQVEATRPSSDLAPLIIPRCPDLSVPVEISSILWEH